MIEINLVHSKAESMAFPGWFTLWFNRAIPNRLGFMIVKLIRNYPEDRYKGHYRLVRVYAIYHRN